MAFKSVRQRRGFFARLKGFAKTEPSRVELKSYARQSKYMGKGSQVLYKKKGKYYTYSISNNRFEPYRGVVVKRLEYD
jgi:hypothetical protein